jgi:hypothetical protein
MKASARLWVWCVAGGAVLLVVALLLRRSPPPGRNESQSAVAAVPAPDAPLTKAAREQILRDAPEAHLADALNRPDGTLREDVAIVGSLIAAYRSNYAGRGNPVGDNREITDTLLGKNPNGIIFLRTGHPAINARGELCDRWGTPFHFHAESGTKMEVRSAGPDRKFWTPDDVFLVP